MLKLTKEEIDACLTKLNGGDLLWVPAVRVLSR